MLKYIKISCATYGAANAQQMLSEEEADQFLQVGSSRRELGIFKNVGKWLDNAFGD